MCEKNVTLYDEQGRCTYEGDCVDKIPNGFGRSYHTNGVLCYEGRWKDGVYHGTGKLYRSDRTLRFQGVFKNGELVRDQRNGPLRYEGEYRSDQFHGFGRLYDTDGQTLRYEGQFADGRYHGQGTSYDRHGNVIYQGCFQNGLYVFSFPDPVPNTTFMDSVVLDDQSTPFSTFQSHNQKIVSNRNGWFLTYLKSRNELYTAQHWRLMHSSDCGRSFDCLYESTDATNPPCIETDEHDNLYVAYPDFVQGHSTLLIFSSKKAYQNPKRVNIPNSAAGKFAFAYDATAKRLYYMTIRARYRQQNTEDVPCPFTALDQNGNILFTRELYRFTPEAKAEYPHLYVSTKGVLHAAWTTENPKYAYLRRSIQHMCSRDGGETWERLDRTPIHLPTDAGERGGSDHITEEHELNLQTWLANMTEKNGKLHFLYSPHTDDPNKLYGTYVNPYMRVVRYDVQSGKKDLEIEPKLCGTHIHILGTDGFFTHDVQRAHSPLYFVGRVGNRIACLVSRTNGEQWEDYAIGPAVTNDIYAVSGCRHVTQDGWIVGAYTERVRDETYEHTMARAKTHLIRIRADQ